MPYHTYLEQLAYGVVKHSVLHKGSTQHDAVQELQRTLYTLGFGQDLRGERQGVDGVYGKATIAAVRHFCERNGLRGTGEHITPTIARKLLQRYYTLGKLQQLASDIADHRIAETLYRGSEATVAIRTLQTLLNELGFGQALQWEKYGADGYYGTATAKAVASFAHQQSLISDGRQLTQLLAERIVKALAPFYGPQWNATHGPTSLAQTSSLLTVFTGSHFVGKKVIANKNFLPALDRVNQYAQESAIKVYVTSSLRLTTTVKGAIVAPATFSNHLVGHAIDMNLIYGPDATFCNAKVLAQTILPPPVDIFIQAIRRDPGLRWGGDFKARDVVHIDDDAYHRDKAQWLASYEAIQRQYREGNSV